MRNKSRIKSFAVISLIIIIVIALLFTCQIKFGSINIPRIVYAIVTVNTDKNDYVIIKDLKSNKITNKDSNKRFFANRKKVIIATPNENYKLNDYAKENGYSITDEQGSLFTIEKDGTSEEVDVSIIGYYSLWKWY